MRALALLVIVAGCGSDAPQLLDLHCNPSPLSTGSSGPYSLGCGIEFDGKPGDVRWKASSTDGTTWASGSGYIDGPARDAGAFQFTMSNMQAPPLGTLTITVSVDHVDGIDGPEGDTITTQVEVVP